jgi:hypothetical protein
LTPLGSISTRQRSFATRQDWIKGDRFCLL